MPRELPDGARWATAPLLDEANVGRYVWYVFNSNTKFAEPLPIVKIGRTNVHVGTRGARPSSLRVDPETAGHTASGTNSSGFSESCHTEQWRLDTERRYKLTREIRSAESRMYRQPPPVLERIVELLRPDDGLTDRRADDHERILMLLENDDVLRAIANVTDLDANRRELAGLICDVFYGRD